MLGVGSDWISQAEPPLKSAPYDFLQRSTAATILEAPLEEQSATINQRETMIMGNQGLSQNKATLISLSLDQISTTASFGSPTRDDGRRALKLVETFLLKQHWPTSKDYVTLGKLWVKLDRV